MVSKYIKQAHSVHGARVCVCVCVFSVKCAGKHEFMGQLHPWNDGKTHGTRHTYAHAQGDAGPEEGSGTSGMCAECRGARAQRAVPPPQPMAAAAGLRALRPVCAGGRLRALLVPRSASPVGAGVLHSL